jgi:wyosine [tRNA(Phe)-imidazoG37] synthetase (radical SAM superfamily)
MTITFGPVPSRRLGRSLGINNIPPKSCSYSCLYCQVGATHGKLVVPQEFYQPVEIRQMVDIQVQKARAANERIDYLTFVPDGEPGLDINLGKSIELLRPLGIPIAIISNASLLWQPEVRKAIVKADWISVKVDSVEESVWQKLNRPHENLRLTKVLDGIRQFAQEFCGNLVSETMLIKNINDGRDNVAEVAVFLQEIGVATAYLAIPTRPCAEPNINGASEMSLNQAYQQFVNCVPKVEFLLGYEEDEFAFSGDIENDLLSITAVHPMRESAVRALLDKAQANWEIVEKLITEGKLVKTEYLGKQFYLRRFVGE